MTWSLTAVSEQDVSSVASEASKPVEAPFRGDEIWDDIGFDTVNDEMEVKDKSMSKWEVQ